MVFGCRLLRLEREGISKAVVPYLQLFFTSAIELTPIPHRHPSAVPPSVKLNTASLHGESLPPRASRHIGMSAHPRGLHNGLIRITRVPGFPESEPAPRPKTDTDRNKAFGTVLRTPRRSPLL